MSNTNNKVDMEQMNAAIDKVLALPATTQAEVKERRRNSRRVQPNGRGVASEVGKRSKRKGK